VLLLLISNPDEMGWWEGGRKNPDETKEKESLISSIMVNFKPSVVLRSTNMDAAAGGPVELEPERLCCLLGGVGEGRST